MKQEFPKMLYKGDASCIVNDENQQAAVQKDGWHEFGVEPKKKKPGRPKKDANAD